MTNREVNVMKNCFKSVLVFLLCAVMLVSCGGDDDLEICFHEWEEKVSDEALYASATCRSAAQYYSTCKKCGAFGAPFTHGEPSDHSYSDIVDSKLLVSPATCSHGAVYYKSCEFCGKVGSETFTDSQTLSHNYIEKATKDTHAEAATCEHPNLYYLSCEKCGALSDQTFEFGPSLKHKDTHGDDVCDYCDKPMKVWLEDTPVDNITDKHEFEKN